MHPALEKFKADIEKDLKRVKTEWFNRTLYVLAKHSPVPGSSQYSTGDFINKIILRFNNQSQEFNYTNNPDFYYEITDPFSDISITSYLSYNIFIESLGWKHVPPYRPFTKTLRYSGKVLTDLCNHVFIHEHKPGKQRSINLFKPELNKKPKISLFSNKRNNRYSKK